MKKLRPLGKVTESLEKILWEMSGDEPWQHDMQRDEVVALVVQWFETHNRSQIPRYVKRHNVKVRYSKIKMGFPDDEQ